jgi:hypothetical protein
MVHAERAHGAATSTHGHGPDIYADDHLQSDRIPNADGLGDIDPRRRPASPPPPLHGRHHTQRNTDAHG